MVYAARGADFFLDESGLWPVTGDAEAANGTINC